MLLDNPMPELDRAFVEELMASPELAKRLKLKPMEPEINPFAGRLELEARKKRAGTTEVSVITDAETGARIGYQQEDIYYVDRARFVKVMEGMLGAAFDLDGAGQKLFWIVMDLVTEKAGQDMIYLAWTEEITISRKKKVRVSESSFYRGVKSLKEAEFIAPTERKGWYWINPAYLFNGDRVRFVNTFIRENPNVPEEKRPRVRYPEDKKPREKKREVIGKDDGSMGGKA